MVGECDLIVTKIKHRGLNQNFLKFADWYRNAGKDMEIFRLFIIIKIIYFLIKLCNF